MNTFKILGAAGSGLLFFCEIILLIGAATNGSFEYWEYDTYVYVALKLVGFAILMVAFLMIPESLNPSVQEQHKVQNSDSAQVTIPSVGQWLGWILLLGLPLVGLVMTIVWLTDKTNPVRRNWVLANLMLFGIVFVLYLLMIGVFVLVELA